MANDTSKSSSRFPETDPPSYQLYWFSSILLAVVFAGCLALYPPILAEVKATPPTWVMALGRFHPIVVHLPIGILFLLALMEVFCLFGEKERRWGHAALFALFIAAVSSVVGAVFGIFLAQSGGYEGGSFFMHQALCLAMAGVVVSALFLRLSAMSSGGRGVMLSYRGLLGLAFLLMGVGAHFGANMVHGSTYLTKYAPESISKIVHSAEEWLLSYAYLVGEKMAEAPPAAPAPTAAPSSVPGAGSTPPAATTVAAPATGKLVFQHLILPILDAKCNKCHNEEKSKGDLRMDTYALLIQGGAEAGKTVVPSHPEQSLAITLAELPEDDDEHMPPSGKDQLTPQELALLKWWVLTGASDKTTLAEARIPAELKTTAEAILSAPTP